jgi:hypothetical protein
MRFLSTLFLACAGFASAGFAPSSQAEDLSATDALQIRGVIEAQLDAIVQNDAASAFSFASPKLRLAFSNATQFLLTVQRNYPVLYRHATVIFLSPQSIDGVATQAVYFTDGRGALWIARYRLERQQDQSWRINTCHAIETVGQLASAGYGSIEQSRRATQGRTFDLEQTQLGARAAIG